VTFITPIRPQLETRWLGRVPYADAAAMQLELHEKRSLDEISDQLLLLEHPPVYTRGSKGQDEERRESFPEIPTLSVDRGGATTYHGPGQLVGYPIVKLEGARRDLHRYVRDLEQVLIQILESYGIAAATSPRGTGVWVGDRKIASIGVRVARWVTRHGFALNVDPELAHFGGIVPCGIQDVEMTSIARELGRAPAMSEVVDRARIQFARIFEYGTEGGAGGR
jgi:lipoate-protein ligase B